MTKLVMEWLPVESMPEIIANNVFLIPKIIVSLIVGFGWNYNMQRLFVYKNRDFKKYFVKRNTQKDKNEEVIKSENKRTDDI